jgi:hypothetical protein
LLDLGQAEVVRSQLGPSRSKEVSDLSPSRFRSHLPILPERLENMQTVIPHLVGSRGVIFLPLWAADSNWERDVTAPEDPPPARDRRTP